MMLLKRTTLDTIAAGDVDLVFRRWKRPTVKAGGTLRTSVGMLEIRAVERVNAADLTPDDALRAGFPSKAALLRELRRHREGDLYRIEVGVGGEDPLVRLRENAALSPEDIAALVGRLDRLDATSRHGVWTRRTLHLLEMRPHVRAEDLAEAMGLDKRTFKTDVRKLKALGLTISHSPGYELSPRGRALLEALGN